MRNKIKDYPDKIYLILSKEEMKLLNLKKGQNKDIYVISKEDCPLLKEV